MIKKEFKLLESKTGNLVKTQCLQERVDDQSCYFSKGVIFQTHNLRYPTNRAILKFFY